MDGERAPRPNWFCVMCSMVPITGKVSNATELRTKTVPSETAICSSLASVIGATAAIALPPQIAVPAEIRKDVLCSTLSSFPSPQPSNIGKSDASRRIKKPRSADTDNLLQIHSKAKANHRNLKQEFRCLPGRAWKRMSECKPEEQAARQRQGWRQQAAGSENNTDEK